MDDLLKKINSQTPFPPTKMVHRITTACNRACPHCSATIHNKARKIPQIPLEQVKEEVILSTAPESIGYYSLTGGEPTIHKDFVTIAENIGSWLREGLRPNLTTNGWLFGVDPDACSLLRFFGRVAVTIYPEKQYPGAKSNRKECLAIEKYCKENGIPLYMERYWHMPRNSKSAKLPCGWLLKPSCYDMVIYPCCVTAGVEGAVGTPLAPGWYEKIQEVAASCSTCFMSTKKRYAQYINMCKKGAHKLWTPLSE